jgi:serine/threonine protein kinase
MVAASSDSPRIARRYQRLGIVGRGATGAVYRARDRLHRRLVALKTISPLEPPDAGVFDSHLPTDQPVPIADLLARRLRSRGGDGSRRQVALRHEVLRGAPISPRADLYSVGVIAHEILAGRHPFDTSSPARLLQSVFQSSPDFTTAAIAPGLQPVLQRLLARDPADRFENALDVVGALTAGLGRPLPLETVSTRESFLQSAGIHRPGQRAPAPAACPAGPRRPWRNMGDLWRERHGKVPIARGAGEPVGEFVVCFVARTANDDMAYLIADRTLWR